MAGLGEGHDRIAPLDLPADGRRHKNHQTLYEPLMRVCVHAIVHNAVHGPEH